MVRGKQHFSRDKIVAIVLANNEAATIGAILGSLNKLTKSKHGIANFFSGNKPILGGIIVVDDGSTDKTAKIARKKGAQVVSLGQNCGKSYAFFRGVNAANELGAQIVVTLDADLKPVSKEQLESLVKPVLSGQFNMAKGTILGDTGDLSGQRAIRMSVLMPLLRGNEKWGMYFGLKGGKLIKRRNYGLETALNVLVPKSIDVNTEFETRRPYGAKTPIQIQKQDALEIAMVYWRRLRLANKLRQRRWSGLQAQTELRKRYKIWKARRRKVT